jgi:hypothetical protein
VVLVDHANWAPFRSAGRGQVTKAVPVLDVSAKNDWSEVRVWYQPSREYGSRTYKTQGFVYRPGNSVVPASLRTEAPRAPAEAPVTAPVTAKTEPAALSTPKAKSVIEAPVVEAKVTVPTEAPAIPAAESDLGKFDARAWAEQA